MPGTWTLNVPEPVNCQLSPGHGPAIADASVWGRWGYVCAADFDLHGCRLGTGAGQILVTAAMLREMMEWVADVAEIPEGGDTEQYSSNLDRATVQYVERHYDGGVKAFAVKHYLSKQLA